MSSDCVCIIALDSWDRQAKGTSAKLLAAVEVASIPARLKVLGITPIPLQLVHYAGDIVFAAIGCAGTFDQDQTVRPQHGLVGVAVNLTLSRDEPASFIPHRLRYGVQFGGITGGWPQHQHLRLCLLWRNEAAQRTSNQRIGVLVSQFGQLR